jgi:hypothetical protein
MVHKEDHSDCKDLTIKTMIGSTIINITIHVFTDFAMATNFHEHYTNEYFLLCSYFYITFLYTLTYHQFIFATSNIKSRFKLLNRNIKFVQ